MSAEGKNPSTNKGHMCQLARILVAVYFTFCKFTECSNSTDILNLLRLNKEERAKKKIK